MLSAALSWMKLLKGATPVPGPTIMTGAENCGKVMVPFLVQMGIRTPSSDKENFEFNELAYEQAKTFKNSVGT